MKMTVPKILLGCAVLMVLVCVGVPALVWFAVPEVRNLVTSAFDWEKLAQTWQPPPADAGPERLFPATVEDARKEKDDDQAAVPNLKIVFPGRRATYKTGQDSVEVFAYPRVPKNEREALFNRLDSENFSSKFKMDSPTYSRFIYNTGNEKGVLWWCKDWMFLARGPETSDPEKLLRAYVEQIGKGSVSEEERKQDRKTEKGRPTSK